MITISRKPGEGIVIDGNITLTVVEIRGDKVRLGVVYPPGTAVHRHEVYEAVLGRPSQPPEESGDPRPPQKG